MFDQTHKKIDDSPASKPVQTNQNAETVPAGPTVPAVLTAAGNQATMAALGIPDTAAGDGDPGNDIHQQIRERGPGTAPAVPQPEAGTPPSYPDVSLLPPQYLYTPPDKSVRLKASQTLDIPWDAVQIDSLDKDLMERNLNNMGKMKRDFPALPIHAILQQKPDMEAEPKVYTATKALEKANADLKDAETNQNSKMKIWLEKRHSAIEAGTWKTAAPSDKLSPKEKIKTCRENVRKARQKLKEVSTEASKKLTEHAHMRADVERGDIQINSQIFAPGSSHIRQYPDIETPAEFTGVHEMGHLLEWYLCQNNPNLENASQAAEDFRYSLYSRAIVGDAVKKSGLSDQLDQEIKRKTDQPDNPVIKDNLSLQFLMEKGLITPYGSTDYHEAFAEAIARHYRYKAEHKAVPPNLENPAITNLDTFSEQIFTTARDAYQVCAEQQKRAASPSPKRKPVVVRPRKRTASLPNKKRPRLL